MTRKKDIVMSSHNVADMLAEVETLTEDTPVRHSPTDETLHALKQIFTGSAWTGRSLVSLSDVTAAEMGAVLSAARGLKALHKRKSLNAPCWHYPRTLGMIFEKPSLRTRVSFETAMVHLGGHAVYLAPADIGLGQRESVADVAAALSRWVDIISARVFAHETVVELAANASAPVINALSDREHPIQAFADMLTLQERLGRLGSHLKMTYIGDGNNVLHALMLACAKLGVNLSAACPEGYYPDAEYLALANAAAASTGAVIEVVSDPARATKDADALYTDVWTSMGQESEKAQRLAAFDGYCIDSKLMAHAKPGAIVLHCLPAHPGEEIAADVYDAHRTVIMDQAENRMHTQKALIALILGI